MLGSKEELTQRLKREAQELIDQAYERGFKAGKGQDIQFYDETVKKAYQSGLDDAWECARKICTNWCISDACLAEIFGRGHTIDDIMRLNSASEAISKIKAYEEQKKVKDEKKPNRLCVGDEVEFDGGKGVVIDILNDDEMYILNDNGCIEKIDIRLTVRTGRVYQIGRIIADLQEDEE